MRRLGRYLVVATTFLCGWFIYMEVLTFSGLSLPFLRKAAPRIDALFHPHQPTPTKEPELSHETSGLQSPFIDWFKGLRGLVVHPFFAYTRVPLPGKESDYFGFNNHDKRIYFNQPKGKLVVITGNSEAAGFHRTKSIACWLEEKLNQRSSEKWQVLNLAMDNYTVPYEIGAYVYLAYHLKPDYVISHSFLGDLMYGWHVPPEFLRLGLIYYPQFEVWNLQAAGIKPFPGAGEIRYNKQNSKPHLVEAYLGNAARYRDIVQGNHGHFILGIQPFDFEWGVKAFDATATYKELIARIPTRGFDWIDFTKFTFKFIDGSVHSDDAGAELTAEIYCNHILGHHEETGDGAKTAGR